MSVHSLIENEKSCSSWGKVMLHLLAMNCLWISSNLCILCALTCADICLLYFDCSRQQVAGKQQASSKQVSSRSKKGICKLFLFLVVGMQCCDRAFAALQCRENFSVCLFLLSYYCVSLSSSLLLLTSTVTYKLSQILNVGLFMTRELTEICRQQFLRKSSKKADKNYYSDYCVLHKIEGQWREGR